MRPTDTDGKRHLAGDGHSPHKVWDSVGVTTFGDRLKAARAARKVGANELGRAIGQGPGYVSKLEKGERGSPTADNAAKLAAALRVRLDWLTTGKGPMDLGASDAAPATVAPDSPLPPSPVPLSPTPMSPIASNGTKRADNGRWRAYAAIAHHFGAAATEALEAGASEKVLDAASDRLAGQAPDYPTARQAIIDAAEGVAAFRRIFGKEADAIPGSLHVNASQPSSPAGRGKRTSSR
jgi:hypothetical protein